MRVVPSPSHFSIYFCPLRADIGRWLPPAALWRWPWERLPANCGEDRRRQEEDMGPTAKKKGLTVKRVENLLRAGVPGRHTDGDVKGLMLCVESRSSAAWTLRWQRNGRVRHMGLGSARDLPLASAREKAREQRERIARDIDPLELRRKERETQRQAEERLLTFKQAAERC